MFTLEKTLYRTLRRLVVSSGFTSAMATVLMEKFRGLEQMKSVWECFDPKNEKLSKFMPQKVWQPLKTAQQMRNEVVHGKLVYSTAAYAAAAADLLVAMELIRAELETRYGYDGWTKGKIRKKSKLHMDPHVKV
jgi:hypothetical protein